MSTKREGSVPASLEQYRRPRPLVQKATRRQPTKNAKKPYVRAFRRALTRLTKEAIFGLGSDGAGGAGPTISVSSVLAAAGLGRSQLYNAYPHLLAEFATAKERVLAALRRRGAATSLSKTQLLRDLRQARKDLKARVAAVASTQLADVIKKLGPEFRRREKMAAEIAELRKRLSEAEMSKRTQANLNRSLMVEANRRS